jgi:hypothetical protein
MSNNIFRRFCSCRTVPSNNCGICCLDVGCLWHIVVDGGLDIGNDQHNANGHHDSVLNKSKSYISQVYLLKKRSRDFNLCF